MSKNVEGAPSFYFSKNCKLRKKIPFLYHKNKIQYKNKENSIVPKLFRYAHKLALRFSNFKIFFKK